jgi:peptidoglycan/LPS O-acetylase OafA/YrhL
LLVVFSHAAKYTMDFHQGWTFHALFEGAHGVDLFFVISGFCLSYPILALAKNGKPMNFDVLKFWARRVVRIVPAYWIVFALTLAVALFVRTRGGDVPWPAIKIPSVGAGIGQLFFFDNGTTLVGSFWTLAVEFRWYVMFPPLLWLYIRAPRSFFAIGLASLALYHFTPLNKLDFATLPAFLLGIVAADLTIRQHGLCRLALPLFVASVGASVLLEPKGHLAYAVQNQVWWQVAAFFLVLAAGGNGWLRSVFSWKPLAFIGTASYSIYLLHDPIEAWYGHTGGQSALLAALAGTLLGVLGWMLFERVFTNRTTRDRLVNLILGRTPRPPRLLPVPAPTLAQM